jgi:formiminotetrahydrofolate cyclodeaminase
VSLSDLSLRDWVEALASARGVPAGASLAAASAAAAAALLSKVARVAARESGRRDLPERFRAQALRLLDCAERDAAAYRAWAAGDRDAGREAVAVPQEIESLCRATAEECLALREGLAEPVAEDLHASAGILKACAQAAGSIAAFNRRTMGSAS